MDQVHDLQQVYRKILHSMSHPGTFSNLEPFAEKVDYDLPCYEATFLSAMTLLDAEVTFAIIPENSQQLSTKLTAYTLAKSAPIHEADYIIVLQDALQQDIVE
ncbi:phosphonate C-P lyase system protein PhnH, partial [Virgibacillus salexigens]|uniref:phosphonate C-P lyase system protein PhnH n=1 Tax=Virgibacillus massiliensis TaxID=1462526 RepID=UPI0018E1C427